MVLETHNGTVMCGDDREDVELVVLGLTEVDEAFVVYNRCESPERHYLQAAGTVDEGFIAEYREGHAGAHYRCDRRISADHLTALLLAYHHEEPLDMVIWDRVAVGERAAQA